MLRSLNIIKPNTGAKVDLVPLPSELTTRAAFARRQHIVYDEINRRAADFAIAEDVLIANKPIVTASHIRMNYWRGGDVTACDRVNKLGIVGKAQLA